MKIGNFSGNAEACFKMGKEAFIAAHPHVYDVESVWKKIEKAAKKTKKESEDNANGPEEA